MTVNDITEAVESTATAVTEAASNAVEAITRPSRRRTTARLATATAVLLPEQIALRGLSLVKARARRKDVVGQIAYRGLDLVHGSLKELSLAITRLERASEPPARTPRAAAKRGTAARARRTARRTVKRTAAAA